MIANKSPIKVLMPELINPRLIASINRDDQIEMIK